MWTQHTVTLPAKSRGFHLITPHIERAIPELVKVRVGLLHVFIQHTSASLTINENADPDVRVDFETAMNHVVPETLRYVHTIEGPDDMPAHVKASMMGASISIPVRNGALHLGTWQGIYLCEHRNSASGRTVVITLQGETVA
jgi:secondary thiamine-phosphate synthase enzyme